MKVAVIGSRGLTIANLGHYLPSNTTEIVSGGAKGIDSCAEQYAQSQGVPVRVFLPDYKKYGKNAPLKRNLEIIRYADTVLAFWDGNSKGTKYVIDECKKSGKPVRIFTNGDEKTP